MTMELRQLRYFIAVAEEMHFGRAAARLHMTQPPLSQAIQALEASLGTLLFMREKRGIQLTSAGEALLPEAIRLISQAQALPEFARRAASGEAGRLSLAFVSTADYNILPPVLRDFREKFPQVRIELREATTDVQADELGHGRIDAGFVIPPLPEQLGKMLDYLPLFSEPLVLASPADLPLLRKKSRISLADARDLPLVIFPRHIAPALHDTILSCFHDAGIAPRIAQEAIQMQTIVSLVSAGMGIALVPQSVSNLKRSGVEYRSLAQKAPRIETGIAWRRDNPSPTLQAFLTMLKKKR